MKYTYAFLVKYRYRILLIVSLFTIAQIALLLLDIVSFTHERLLVWSSFFTLLAWTGIVGLIGVISPVGDGMQQKYAYLALFAILMAVVVNIGLIGAGVYWHVFWGNGLPILVWIGAAGLIGAFASAGRSKKKDMVLVDFLLILAFWAGLLMVIKLAIAGILSDWFQVLLMFGLSSLVTTMLVGAIVFRTVPADRPLGLLLYSLFGLKVLGITSLACVLLAALFFTATLFMAPPYFLPLLAAIVVAVAGTAFLGTIRQSARRGITIAIFRDDRGLGDVLGVVN